MAAITYCNTGSDLSDVFKPIETYNRKTTLSGWEQVGATAVWKIDGPGFVEMVYENGVMMTAGSSAAVSAGEFFYDTDADILYVQVSDSGDPSTDTLQTGLDWDARKAEARNDAQEWIEAVLRPIYAVPFQKITSPGQSYNSRDYDYQIRRATALLTCSILVEAINPDDPAATMLRKKVDNPGDLELGEEPGILQRIVNGQITLRTQRTAREVGGYNVYEGAGVTSDAYLEVPEGQKHGVSTYQVWRVQIDGAGAATSATYKVSYDGGATFDKTAQACRTSDSDDQRIDFGAGIDVRFVGTFEIGEYWDFEFFPHSDAVTNPRIGAVKLDRG